MENYLRKRLKSIDEKLIQWLFKKKGREKMKLKCNCCDGIYNSFDVHFTSACDNKCAHCIDKCYDGLNISKPDVNAIVKTIVENKEGLDKD